MCFGIPMQVQSIDGFIARCEAQGVTREVNLFMLQHEDIAVGDYVVAHLGHAIDKVSGADAAAAWEIYEAMLAAEDAAAGQSAGSANRSGNFGDASSCRE